MGKRKAPNCAVQSGKRIKVQAQRKFAHGAPTIPVQGPKEEPSPPAERETPKDIVFETEQKSFTEDFLTFLCFKGTKKSPPATEKSQDPGPDSPCSISNSPTEPAQAQDTPTPTRSLRIRYTPKSPVKEVEKSPRVSSELSENPKPPCDKKPTALLPRQDKVTEIPAGPIKNKYFIPYGVRKQASQTPTPAPTLIVSPFQQTSSLQKGTINKQIKTAACRKITMQTVKKCDSPGGKITPNEPLLKSQSPIKSVTSPDVRPQQDKKSIKNKIYMTRTFVKSNGLLGSPAVSKTRSGTVRRVFVPVIKRRKSAIKLKENLQKSKDIKNSSLSSDDEPLLKTNVARRARGKKYILMPVTRFIKNGETNCRPVRRTRQQIKRFEGKKRLVHKGPQVKKDTIDKKISEKTDLAPNVADVKEKSNTQKECNAKMYTESDEEPLAAKKSHIINKSASPSNTKTKPTQNNAIKTNTAPQNNDCSLTLDSCSKAQKYGDVLKDINVKFDKFIKQAAITPKAVPAEVNLKAKNNELSFEQRTKKKFVKHRSYIQKWIEESAECALMDPPVEGLGILDAMPSPKTPSKLEVQNQTDLVDDSKIYDFNSESESKTSHTYRNKKKTSNVGGKVDDSEGHLFYIPLTGSEHVIQGVAVKLDSHDGSQQKVIMRAKLVTSNGTEAIRDKKDPLPPIKKSDKHEHGDASSTSRSFRQMNGEDYKKMMASFLEELASNGPHTLPAEAPVFRPTSKEFKDPLKYIERISKEASRYGLCRIVPPSSFQGECQLSDVMRFTPQSQYVHRMLHRWGTSSRQMCAIKKHLAFQGVSFNPTPKLNGIEIDLPRLYSVVENMGGLQKVLEKKMWLKVAEEMGIPFNAQCMGIRLEEIYWKYLLPYCTLSVAERETLLSKVDSEWKERYARMKARAADPMNVMKDPRDEEEESSSDVTEDVEECVMRGKSITLGAFSKLAKNIMTMHFGKVLQPTPNEVEKLFWDHVTLRNSHVCVSSGSIDSGVMGYGFPNAKTKNSPISKHPWNLKVLTNNSGSVLRALGPMIGVTVPTIHVGMLFSSCCWYQDPHGLPWIEYLHQGAPKVWYGVPAMHGLRFQVALESIVPGLCQRKTIWLLSDTAMVPPRELLAGHVSVCRTVQQPGEFVVVFPKAFTSSLCTGYSVSESVYFAPTTWLQSADRNFDDIRNSCEPSMFSLERLIISLCKDARSSRPVLKAVLPILEQIIQKENKEREDLFKLGLQGSDKTRLFTSRKKALKHQDDAEECHQCRKNLSLSMLFNNDDKTTYCLPHGAEFLALNPSQVQNCEMFFLHSVKELKELYESTTAKYIQKSKNMPGPDK